MSSIVLPTGTRGWNRLPGYRRRRDILFGFRAADLELVDLATGQPISFSRASPGGLVPVLGGSGASRGIVYSGPHAHNVPRFMWQGGRPYMLVEPGTTNSVRNPRAEGAAVGEIGAGGSLPTHWSVVPRGLTPEVVALGEEDGIPYVDLRLHGVPDATADAILTFAGTTEVATQPGETWTGSYYCRLVGGSMDGVSSIRLRVQERAGDGNFLAAGDVPFDPAAVIRLGDARRAYTHTMAEPEVAYVRHTLSVFVTAGLPVDITLRVGGPQLEPGSVATALTLPPEGMLAASTRARDLVRAAWSHGVISCTVLMAGISAGGDQGLIGTAGARLFQLGAGTSIMDRAFVIRAFPADGVVVATLGNGSAAVNSTGSAIPIGHEYIRAGALEIDTVVRTGRVRLLQWHRETPGSGAWTDASAAWSSPLDVTPLLAQGWAQPAITIGNVYSGSRPGRLILSDCFVLPGIWTLDAACSRVGIAV